jgi:NAD(P)-dependent dehydrogenase (short-subunit alcohol dehydrogenase family)
MHPLHGKVALITGGSSGIGRAVALRFAEHGVKVALAARSAEKLDATVREVQAKGGTALALPTDVTDAEQCQQAVEKTVAQFEQLDLLICSAGVSLRAYFAECTLEAIDRLMRVNFYGTLYPTHFALPHIRKSKGSLVAVTSLSGVRTPPSYAVYGASKFAVWGLSDGLRLELRREGVHVGVVAPGFVDTPLRQQVQGGDGTVMAHPPKEPFRIWPVAKVVKAVERLVLKRKRRVLVPGFMNLVLFVDQLCGGRLADRVLESKFPPDAK